MENTIHTTYTMRYVYLYFMSSSKIKISVDR